MAYSSKIIFGPVLSRRFGLSLGIDLSPSNKQCNYDCLYCELESSKPILQMDTYPSVDEVLGELTKALLIHKNIDVLTLTANGEPSLYPHLEKLISKINKIKQNTKTLILSNGSRVKENIEAFKLFDIVKLSLDCASQKCFKKLDRGHKSLEIESIISSMLKFKKVFKNELVIEVLFVKNINDKKDEVEKIYEILQILQPHRVDISTIDRPPAYKVNPVSLEFLQDTAKYFKGLNINIAYSNKNSKKEVKKDSFTKDELLSLIKRRPLSEEDITKLLDTPSQKIFYKLLKDKLIKEVLSSELIFYKLS